MKLEQAVLPNLCLEEEEEEEEEGGGGGGGGHTWLCAYLQNVFISGCRSVQELDDALWPGYYHS